MSALKKIVRTLFIASLAISAFSPFMTNGNLVSQIAIIALTFVLAVMVALGCLILYGIGNFTKYNLKIRPHKVLLGLAVILGVQIAGLPVIIKVDNHRIKTAKNFCEKHIPAIHEYFAVRGQYPETISLFQIQALKPQFLEGQKVYQKTDDGFVFKFHSPARIAGDYVYRSHEDRWVFYDSGYPYEP